MTAPEKANNLYEKFLQYVPAQEEFEHNYAIKCSLIVVEEVIEDLDSSLEVAEELHPHCRGLVMGSKVFWTEVKKEINKLK